MTSIKEKQVDKVLDRIIGDGDETLKIITKLALMNKELTPEIVDTIEMIKKQNEEDIRELNKEMTLTLDASGNLVLLDVSANILSLSASKAAPLEKVSELDSRDYSEAKPFIPYRLSIGKT